jgi:hypothetical protein
MLDLHDSLSQTAADDEARAEYAQAAIGPSLNFIYARPEELVCSVPCFFML